MMSSAPNSVAASSSSSLQEFSSDANQPPEPKNSRETDWANLLGFLRNFQPENVPQGVDWGKWLQSWTDQYPSSVEEEIKSMVVLRFNEYELPLQKQQRELQACILIFRAALEMSPNLSDVRFTIDREGTTITIKVTRQTLHSSTPRRHPKRPHCSLL